jgi:hypothetical protein
MWRRIGTIAGFFEHGNELSGPVKSLENLSSANNVFSRRNQLYGGS